VDPQQLHWRVGRYPYRSVYAITGEVDVLVGSQQTAELAALIVAEHNRLVDAGHYASTYEDIY
jgi:hypothetical protein